MAQPQPPAKNTIGLVGFIVSLVSLITCGVLAPVGLLLSVIGLFKAPRGFAIAGTILGVIFSLFGALVGFGLVAAVLGIQQAGSVVQQQIALGLGGQEIKSYHSHNGQVPDEPTFDQLLQNVATHIPGVQAVQFQVQYRYEVVDDHTVRLTFPGFDKQFGTQDDLTELIDTARP